jgi:hypothetical protein
MSSENPKQKQVRKVSFNNRVAVRKTLHITNYTNDEVEACWYNARETEEIRRHIRSILMVMESGDAEADDGVELCRRGLECFTFEGMKGRKRRRNRAKAAVFEEQDRQYDADEEMDDEKIAKAYMKRTRSSRDIGLILGIVDERNASGDDEAQQESKPPNVFPIAKSIDNLRRKCVSEMNRKVSSASAKTSMSLAQRRKQTSLWPTAA